MLFNSFECVALCFVTLFFYYLKGLEKYQKIILILASFIFYGFNLPWLTLLLVFSILINSISSYMVYKSPGDSNRFKWAVFGAAANLLVLIFFKYSKLIYTTMFSGTSISNDIAQLILLIPLPVGISFFTFQGISLVIDTYRAKKSGEKLNFQITNFKSHLWNTALFKAFFPQLVSGPITKAHNFMPQIRIKKLSDVDWESAFRCLVLGFFLKMVVADNLASQTFWISYPHFTALTRINLFTLLFGYSIQIFADFAGYSAIAIGLGFLFGYRLPVNFNYPYISKSLSEFWTRWNISLSTWLKQYLYIPLGGSRNGSFRTYINLIIVMFLGGLWHGAAWSYSIWGLWHGLGLVLERLFGINNIRSDSTAREILNPLYSTVRIVLVFSFVSFGWLFFKLDDFDHARNYISLLFLNDATVGRDFGMIYMYSLPVAFYYLRHYFQLRYGNNLFGKIDPAIYGFMLFLVLVNAGRQNAFIYFQF